MSNAVMSNAIMNNDAVTTGTFDAGPPQRPALAAVLLEAARVRTLPAGVAPVLVGTAVAIAADGFTPLPALLALFGAIAIQVGTNYANDYFDWKNGADTDARVGPRRATQAGLVAPSTMRAAFIGAFVVATVCGIGLTAIAGWPVVVIGVLSVLFGILYTGGPRPLGYLGLGDVLVLVFFGPVAVVGTDYVQRLVVSETALLLGLATGLLSTAILTVNNLRDRHTDVHAHKRTLAVRFGARFARTEYLFCVVAAYALVVVVALRGQNPWLALVALTVPMAVARVRDVHRLDGPALNPLLGGTGKLLVLFAITTSLGLAAPRLVAALAGVGD